MERRGLGVLLLVAAVVTMIVGSGLRGQRVVGYASRLIFPGPPAVGDCVTEPMPESMNVLADISNPFVYPQLTMAPCSGARYGEVVAVIADPATVRVTDYGSSTGWSDTNMDSCWSAALQFIGFDPAGAPVLGLWNPVLTFRPMASSPSSDQQTAGQHWLACLVQAQDFSGTVTPIEPYAGTLRNATATGTQRDRIGMCANGSDLDRIDTFVGCSTEHTLELFGSGGIGDATLTRDDVLRSCRQLISMATGIGDLGAAGALTATVSVGEMNPSSVTAGRIPAFTSVTCGITTTGGAELDGSLRALGDLPLPWA